MAVKDIINSVQKNKLDEMRVQVGVVLAEKVLEQIELRKVAISEQLIGKNNGQKA